MQVTVNVAVVPGPCSRRESVLSLNFSQNWKLLENTVGKYKWINGRGSIRRTGNLSAACSLGASLQMAQNACYDLSPVEQKELRVPSGDHAGAEWAVTPFISLLSVWIFTQRLCKALLCIQNAEVGGEWDTDAQMCNGSIKACAVVLGACAVPTVCQTLVIIWTPAACLQFSPSCFFSCWISSFLAACHMGDTLFSAAVIDKGAVPAGWQEQRCNCFPVAVAEGGKWQAQPGNGTSFEEFDKVCCLGVDLISCGTASKWSMKKIK